MNHYVNRKQVAVKGSNTQRQINQKKRNGNNPRKGKVYYSSDKYVQENLL